MRIFKTRLFKVFLFVLFLLLISIHNIPSLSVRILEDQVIASNENKNKSGSFFMNNTSEKEFLVSTSHVIAWVGTTWNFTVHNNANSSSSMNVSIFFNAPYIYDWWDGSREFCIKPNSAVTKTYISHAIADFPIGPTFWISLVDIDQCASGTFDLTLIHRGYYVNVNTSQTFITNITAWREDLSSFVSSDLSINNGITSGFTGGVGTLAIMVTILLIRNSTKRK